MAEDKDKKLAPQENVEVKSYFKLQCRPVLMEAVCSCGEKCFHEARFLFEDSEGRPIPEDACPINCRVSNLEVDTDEIRRVGDCFEVCGKYTVRVWFEFTDEHGNLDVKVAVGKFKFEVKIPITTDFGCVLCNDTETEFCVITRTLKCISTEVVEVDGATAIKVVVEKFLFVLEQGETLVCLPVCPVDQCECIPPGPVAPGQCIPFSQEPTCDEWCYEDEMECPDACNECPPPQTDKDECIDKPCDD